VGQWATKEESVAVEGVSQGGGDREKLMRARKMDFGITKVDQKKIKENSPSGVPGGAQRELRDDTSPL